jgi:hypothetical protein
MKQKFDMNKIKAAFKKAEAEPTTNFSNNYYPFWNMQEGEEAIIRFLPDKNEDNPTGFLLEKLTHKLDINGETRTIPCLKMYGEDCPICKVSSTFYKDGDKANGKKFWRSKQHLAQALIVKDPLPIDKETGENHEGKVRYLSLGWQLFEVIKTAFESGDLDVPPFAFEGGCDFIIKKTKQGDYDTYAIASRFARKSRDLDEDEIEIAEEGMVDLSTLLPPQPVFEKVQAMLEAAITGARYEEGKEGREDLASKINERISARKAAKDEDEDDDDSPPWEEPKSKKPAAKPSKVVEDEEFEEEADEILATIRNRRKNKAE